MEYRYDFALSFAGEDRPKARELAGLLKNSRLEVFYDEWGQANMWGKPLEIHLDEIYRFRAKFCILFVSKHYTKSGWTSHEFTCALSAARERRTEYILPLRVDDTDLPGLPSGIGALDLRSVSMAQVADRASEKLRLVTVDTLGKQTVAVERPDKARGVDAPIRNEAFTRRPIRAPRALNEPNLVRLLLGMWPDVPDFERAKTAVELHRVIGHKEHWNYDDESLDASYPYTCWRTETKVYYSTLPGPIFKPQITWEFSIIPGSDPQLMCTSVWTPRAGQWGPWDVDKFRSTMGNVWADRSGCSMTRESAIYLAKLSGFEFAPPVVPTAGNDESLCSWTDQRPEMDWLDWDRDPRLTGPGFVGEQTYYHYDSDTALHVFNIHGGWRNAALFAFYDTLDRTLPSRISKRLLQHGCVRVDVFLGLGRKPTPHGHSALARLNVAVVQLVAAQREYPLHQSELLSALPPLTLAEEQAFESAIAQLAEQQFVKSAHDGSARKGERWQKLRRYGASPLRYKLWAMSPDELSVAAAEIIFCTNNERPN
jgi:hypothetical protein